MLIYLDYNASAPLRPQAKAAMAEAMSLIGNGSSVHQYGRKLRQTIDQARQTIASFFGVTSPQVVFTSGATEANNMVIRGFPGPVIVSAVEHDSVGLARTRDLHVCPVDEAGIIVLSELEALLQALPQPCLVSVMLANNETGVIQPLAEIIQLARSYGALVHSDIVQAVGKQPLPGDKLSVDYAVCSGHKIGAAAGIGVLLRNLKAPLRALQNGGGQEQYLRPGSENLLGIISLEASIQTLAGDNWYHVEHLRNLLESKIRGVCPDSQIFSQRAPRLPNTTQLTMPGVKSATQVMHFDLSGIAVSAGAACSSGKVRVSPVLLAMGVASKIAETAIRVSLGPNTQLSEIESFIRAWQQLYHHCHPLLAVKEVNHCVSLSA